jgi:hypothetical protein
MAIPSPGGLGVVIAFAADSIGPSAAKPKKRGRLGRRIPTQKISYRRLSDPAAPKVDHSRFLQGSQTFVQLVRVLTENLKPGEKGSEDLTQEGGRLAAALVPRVIVLPVRFGDVHGSSSLRN